MATCVQVKGRSFERLDIDEFRDAFLAAKAACTLADSDRGQAFLDEMTFPQGYFGEDPLKSKGEWGPSDGVAFGVLPFLEFEVILFFAFHSQIRAA